MVDYYGNKIRIEEIKNEQVRREFYALILEVGTAIYLKNTVDYIIELEKK